MSFWHWAFGLEGLGWYRGHWCHHHHHHPTAWIHEFGGSRGPHNWLPQKLWAARRVHFGSSALRACVFFLPSRPAGESVDGHQRAAPLSSILKSPPRGSYESCARRPPSVGSSISDRAPAKVIYYTTRLTRDKYVDLEG